MSGHQELALVNTLNLAEVQVRCLIASQGSLRFMPYTGAFLALGRLYLEQLSTCYNQLCVLEYVLLQTDSTVSTV